MTRIFISYRRSDSQVITNRIYDSLRDSFGAENVFRDIESISLGQDIRASISSAIERSDIVLVIIGPKWSDERYLYFSDLVFTEIEVAFSLQKRVIPVLVEGASFPSGRFLPRVIYPQLIKIRWATIRSESYDHDVYRLAEHIKSISKSERESRFFDSDESNNASLGSAIDTFGEYVQSPLFNLFFFLLVLISSILITWRLFLPNATRFISNLYANSALTAQFVSQQTANAANTQAAALPAFTQTPPVFATVSPNIVDQIGDATIYVFKDEHIQYPNSSSVELQLFFDHIYITATPSGVITPLPVTQDVSRPTVDIRATLTPRAAIYQQPNVTVPDHLIAVLECGANFEGCGEKEVRLLEIIRPNRWLWFISPKQGISGTQNFRLELWNVENEKRHKLVWDETFSIYIDQPFTVSNETVNTILTGTFGLIVPTVGGIYVLWRSRKRRHKSTNRNKRRK